MNERRRDSYCRRDGWACTPGNRCHEHQTRNHLKLGDLPQPGVWQPANGGELDAWGRGYSAGWLQGYHDGCADD